MTPKPNFFILGAPKCGTTSMAAWLGRHPAIYMPDKKEPNFFNTDINEPPIYGVGTLCDHEALFAAATAAQHVIGEASVFYLSSTVAVANILHYQPDARFIVMLRNPVEMAPALHAEMLIHGLENIGDFRTAWDLQYVRRYGRHVPALSHSWRRQFLFAEVCALGTQLERLFAAVPRGRVLIILLEDIVADPRREYLRALHFLGVHDDLRHEFPVYNSARATRSPRLTRALFLATNIKDRFGIRLNMDLYRRVFDYNVVTTPRKPPSRTVTDMLRCHFANEVTLLAHLLERNLEHWLAPPVPCAGADLESTVRQDLSAGPSRAAATRVTSLVRH